MYDIHCHLLPGIDDGAANLEQSLALARHAVADGVTHMVATPHIQPGVYENNRSSITAAFTCFQSALVEHKIPLRIAMAAEVRLCPEILPMLEKGDIPLFVSMGGHKTMLLELPHSHVPIGTDKMISWLLKQHIDILIAHPERNKELMRDHAKIDILHRLGCKFQITAGSVIGCFGAPSQQAAKYILERGWCDVLASDAHNLHHRPPELFDAQQAAAELIGAVAAAKLTHANPKCMVAGLFQ
ncbi:MAG: capsular biosynthesis protein [Flavobacteriaceae bacterium]|nr:MAG: capsular biosynthesis protein [Flavobacteriaceae bacterium]